jgi:hypothetical protein
VAAFLLALLGALVVTGCGEAPAPPPEAPDVAEEDPAVEPPSTPDVPAPDEQEGTSEDAEEEEFVPPSDWCGTDRFDLGRPWASEEDGAGRSEPLPSTSLIELLEDEDHGIVRAAAKELGRRTIEAAVPALVRLLKTHDDPLARFEAVSALSRMATPDLVPRFIEALGDENSLVRLVAWEALDDKWTFLHGTPPDDDWPRKRGDIRRRLIDGVQEDIREKWRTWWRDNETALRRKWADGDKSSGLRK